MIIRQINFRRCELVFSNAGHDRKVTSSIFSIIRLPITEHLSFEIDDFYRNQNIHQLCQIKKPLISERLCTRDGT